LYARWPSGDCASNDSSKTQGLPRAPRPIITEPQPVSAAMLRASAIERTSPLPVTGIETARTTSPMIVQGALPVKRCERERGCTVMASTPSDSAIWATSTAFRCSSSQPPRIFTVSGTLTAFRRARRISAVPAMSRMRAAPLPLPVIFGMGQPMFRSTMSAPSIWQRSAARASRSGSLPSSCMASGRSSG